jgi:hypothetical protein
MLTIQPDDQHADCKDLWSDALLTTDRVPSLAGNGRYSAGVTERFAPASPQRGRAARIRTTDPSRGSSR